MCNIDFYTKRFYSIRAIGMWPCYFTSHYFLKGEFEMNDGKGTGTAPAVEATPGTETPTISEKFFTLAKRNYQSRWRYLEVLHHFFVSQPTVPKMLEALQVIFAFSNLPFPREGEEDSEPPRILTTGTFLECRALIQQNFPYIDPNACFDGVSSAYKAVLQAHSQLEAIGDKLGSKCHLVWFVTLLGTRFVPFVERTHVYEKWMVRDELLKHLDAHPKLFAELLSLTNQSDGTNATLAQWLAKVTDDGDLQRSLIFFVLDKMSDRYLSAVEELNERLEKSELLHALCHAISPDPSEHGHAPRKRPDAKNKNKKRPN